LDHLQRVRDICTRLAGSTEKLSHGAPTFFVNKRTYAMFVNNHHGSGQIAVWLAAAPGMQGLLMHEAPRKFFRPPYVGVKGWIGIELNEIDDDELAEQIREAWKLISTKRK